MRAWRQDGPYLLDMAGVRMLAGEENWRTKTWRNLPEGVYAQEDGKLGVSEDLVEIVHYMEIDEVLPWWQELLGR